MAQRDNTMTVKIRHTGRRTVDTGRRRRARREHAARGVQRADAGIDARRSASQEIWRPDSNLAVAEEATELVLAERKDLEFLLERSPFHECQAWHHLRIVDVLLEQSRVAVVVTASEENVAAVIVVEVKLESFCKDLVTYDLLTETCALTSNLPIGPILARSHIREIAKCLAACKTTGEILDPAGMIHDARLGAHGRQTLKIRIDAHNDSRISRALLDILLGPLGDSVDEMDGSLATALFAEAQELVLEDHAVSINEHEDERVAVLRKWSATAKWKWEGGD